MFLFAGQLHPHRALYRARQQYRVGAHVIGTVAAVATGGLHANDLDALLCALQQPGEVGAQQVRVLRAGPHADRPIGEVGQRARRAD
ncbi:hypothetical protein D3C75_1224770 [compost metagenome]